MAKREIIKIDAEKCNVCGLCIPNCPEGAIQIIDGKAWLISDLFCDGLGACIGHCPQGAITIEQREAKPYDERKVMANIVKQGENVIKVHLKHLKEHNQTELFQQAINYLKEEGIENPLKDTEKGTSASHGHGVAFEAKSQLRQWLIQLHLIGPTAPYYQGADVLLVADCVAYALGGVHNGISYEHREGKG